jgi:hypothetical protein
VAEIIVWDVSLIRPPFLQKLSKIVVNFVAKWIQQMLSSRPPTPATELSRRSKIIKQRQQDKTIRKPKFHKKIVPNRGKASKESREKKK